MIIRNQVNVDKAVVAGENAFVFGREKADEFGAGIF